MAMTTNAEEFQKLNKKILYLKKKNKGIKSALVIFIILFLVLLAYLIYSEVNTPLFGKWPQIAAQKEEAEIYNEYLISRMDSITRANDLLMENSPYYTGVFFEVQIGAFKDFDLSAYESQFSSLGIDNGDPWHKYVLGKFRNFEKAEAFRKDISSMGIKDAFVVAKIDGNRVTIKQARQAAKSSTY